MPRAKRELKLSVTWYELLHVKKGNPKLYYNEQIKHIKCFKKSLFPPQVPNGQGTPEGDHPGPTPGIKMGLNLNTHLVH